MGISTANVTKKSMSSDLKPGNHTCKINKVELKESNFSTKEKPQYDIYLDLEGEPMGEDFVGFDIDRAKPELGKHKGQVKSVKHGRYSLSTFTFPSGDTSTVEEQVVRFIGNICKQMNSEWIKEVDNKYDTIQAFVAAFNKDKPFKDVFFDVCLGGKEEMKDNGYPKYFMYFPEWKVCKTPIVVAGGKTEVTPYNEALHLIKDANATAVNSEYADPTAQGDNLGLEEPNVDDLLDDDEMFSEL